MISVYDAGNNNFDRLGDAVLCPTSGKVTQVAGGNYSLSMVHPLDHDRKWTHLIPGAIVKVPVPKETIDNSFSGYDADIYKTNTKSDLREGPNAPQTISYTAWDINTNYAVGAKVSNGGRNWQCTYFDETSPWANISPPNCNWWKQIPSSTSGDAVLVTLPAGTELYFVEDYNTTWYKMSTYYGLDGYILKSQVTFDRHVSASENQPRVITEQLFRIQEPTIDDDAQTVTVTGQHVSYDLAGTLISDVNISKASPAMAIGRLMDGLMIPYKGTIATNLTSDSNGTYSGNLKGKNGIFALLDPDKGIVSAFDAKFTRDNWDLFVMAKTARNLGFRLTYGKNVRGVSWKRSDTSLVTRVVPVAKDEGGSDLYLPEKWVDSSNINNYPVIKMEYLKVNGQVGKDDGTGTDTVWTETDLLNYMREKAGERFSVDKVDLIQEEVSIQIEMLGDTAEYAWLKSLDDVLLYDVIKVSNPDIGIDTDLIVTEIEYDIIRKKISGLKVSNVPNTAKRTIAGYNVQNNSITPAKLTDEVTDSIVSQAQGVMPEYSSSKVINGQNQANKIWKTDENGNPDWRSIEQVVVNVNDGNPTLAFGSQSKVGDVAGVDLHVTMPGARASANTLINALSPGTNIPQDDDYMVSQYVGGGTSTETYHRRKMSVFWEYFKGKISSVLGLTATNYGGKAATAGTADSATNASKVNNHTVETDVPSGAVFTDTWHANTANAAGYVKKGSGHANQVWKTDANADPAWRDEAAKFAIWLPSNGYNPLTQESGFFCYSVEPNNMLHQGTPTGLSPYACVFGCGGTMYQLLIYADVLGKIALWATNTNTWSVI